MNLELSMIENEMEKISNEYNIQTLHLSSNQVPRTSKSRFLVEENTILGGQGGDMMRNFPMMMLSNQDNNSLSNSVHLILPTVSPPA